MHILLIHQFFLKDHEGGGSRWNELSRIFVREGHQVTVLAGNAHYMSAKKKGIRRRFSDDEVNIDNIRVVRCYTSERYHRGFGGRLWGYLSFTLASVWAGLFRVEKKIDLVLVTSPPLSLGVSGIIISKIKRRPLVLEIRDLWPESAIETGVLKSKLLIRLAYQLEKYLYYNAKLVSVLTPAFRDILINHKKVSPFKIAEIPNAADFRLADLEKRSQAALRQKLHLPQDVLIICYVGAHGVANHLEQLIETAYLLRDNPVFFLLIGDGGEKQKLINRASEKSLTNIRFVEPVPKKEIFEYIIAADIGASVLKKADVFKTVYSNKTFDYFSCKKPVLMAIDGVSRDLVEKAAAGMYVEPENPADFALKIKGYLIDRSLLKAHGENGYLYAKKHFDREVLGQKYLDYLLKLAGTEK